MTKAIVPMSISYITDFTVTYFPAWPPGVCLMRSSTNEMKLSITTLSMLTYISCTTDFLFLSFLDFVFINKRFATKHKGKVPESNFIEASLQIY